MNEFTFEPALWEQTLEQLPANSQLDAMQFLTLMEPEDEQDLEAALALLEEKGILLNIDGLSAFAPSADGAARLRLEKDMAEKNALPHGLEENDPLRLYLEEIAALPQRDDPESLAGEYAAGFHVAPRNPFAALAPLEYTT